MEDSVNQKNEALQAWLSVVAPSEVRSCEPISGDASFRRYYRVRCADLNAIAVDAPPATENNQAFAAVDECFLKHGVTVPKIYKIDLKQGFMLISDLGNQDLLSTLNEENADALYKSAMDTLLKIQVCHDFSDWQLPDYDRALLLEELQLFRTWYLGRHRSIKLDKDDEATLDQVFDLLIENALKQPQVCVHRDYHSRNLMVLPEANPSAPGLGVLDFQDAVRGAITYDLASLLKDCYIAWPRERIVHWVRDFFDLCQVNNRLSADFETFLKWFDWIGVQRHLKVLGIFSRLKHRDGKSRYMEDFPRVHAYLYEMCACYSELRPIRHFLKPQTLEQEG